ncbi:hypothetical protein IZY60_00140 [Lutibacter sp. B2]|nr:hypothetical protein [Lutibacter sp. B2]
MKQYYHTIIQNGYLGSEILRSSSKCRKWTYKVNFAGAEKVGCQWKVNFILTFICLTNIQECGCQGASSGNMYVITAPEQSVRFERYLGVTKKETIEPSPGNYELCDRFVPVKYVKFLEIETDHIKYEICFI